MGGSVDSARASGISRARQSKNAAAGKASSVVFSDDMEGGVNRWITTILDDGLLTVCDNLDADGDSIDLCRGDCDDTDATINPSAAEDCDGIDNDCSGVADDATDKMPQFDDDEELEGLLAGHNLFCTQQEEIIPEIMALLRELTKAPPALAPTIPEGLGWKENVEGLWRVVFRR